MPLIRPLLWFGALGSISLLATACGGSGRTTSTTASRLTTRGPVALRSIPVVACNGEIQGFPYKYKGASTTNVRLSAADAQQLVSFNEQMLAPRGWKCDLFGGSDGDTLEAYNPSAGFFLSGLGEYRPQEAVSAYYATPGNHALELACPHFPQAVPLLRQGGLQCPYIDSTPYGEAQTHRTPDELDFSDPPAITGGTGSPSGGRNRASGLELFDSVYNQAPYAATGTCTLAPADRHMCALILAYVRSRYAAMMKQR